MTLAIGSDRFTSKTPGMDRPPILSVGSVVDGPERDFRLGN